MSLDQATAIVKHAEVTRDAFLGGRLSLLQPARGFRAGLDSVLLGAAAGGGEGRLLDLGAGVGTAALVALNWNPIKSAVLVESDPAAAELARANIAGNGMAGRAAVVELDLTARGAARAAAGLAADDFATVIANPPYFDAGTAPAPTRAAARHMPAEMLELWVRTAASHAAPGGEVIFIHPADRLFLLLKPFEARFGGIFVLPLSPRAGAPAHRLLLRGIKGSRAPTTLLASRPLHVADGRAFTPEFEAIFRGDDRLHW